jgi:hypothetical protein
MKEQMELYGGFATKTITTNFKTPSGKEDSARDTRAVYPQTELHGEEREGDENVECSLFKFTTSRVLIYLVRVTRPLQISRWQKHPHFSSGKSPVYILPL